MNFFNREQPNVNEILNNNLFKVIDLCEEKDNLNAHCIFSTYQTIANMIDSAKDDKGKV